MNKFKLKLIALTITIGFIATTHKAFAQGMMGGFNNRISPSTSASSTAQDESDGKVIYDKLQSKQTTCQNLTDDDFDVLGDYYMGQRLGDTATHESMNNMMTRMMGEEGEKQMHIALGKRLSGCDGSAPLPVNGTNFLPMMGLGEMMGVSINSWGGGGNPMMGYGGWNNLMGWGGFGLGWIFMLLWWIFVILGIVVLAKWLLRLPSGGHETKTAQDILKERYVKGEISKKEFDQITKDIG